MELSRTGLDIVSFVCGVRNKKEEENSIARCVSRGATSRGELARAVQRGIFRLFFLTLAFYLTYSV